MAAGLPDDNDPHLGETGYWRVIFSMPIIIASLSMFGMIVYVQYDSPKFLINTKKYKDAHKMIDKIYHFEEDRETIFKYIGQTSQKETSKISYYDALFHKDYRVGTWITIVLVIFHELTGINAIFLYSNNIFKEIFTGSSLTPRQGSYFIGLAACLSAASAVVFIKIFTRR